MQSHRGNSLPSANDNNGRHHGDNSFSSSSRWLPPPSEDPQGRQLGQGNPNADGVRCHDQIVTHPNQCDTHRGVGGGRQGGGKVIKQRRHNSSDAHNQRNPHRTPRPLQQQRRIIVTPDVEKPPSTKSASFSGVATPATTTTAEMNEDISKLDPTDPVHAKRIHQRRRQVLFGKNTAGYEEYLKHIPRHKRRHRSVDCPMTPDYMADIPTKRWQGLMNAWRRALHKYDPSDLHLRGGQPSTITLAPRPCMTKDDVQEEQIVQAKASGLQVAFGSMYVGNEAAMFAFNVASEEEKERVNCNTSCDSGVDRDGGRNGSQTVGTIFFDEEAAYQQTMDGGLGLKECDSDSDNDLL